MDAGAFTGLGFVASYWNADAAAIAPLNVVSKLAVQIAWGMGPAARTEPQDELAAWVRRTGSFGLGVVPWGWCNAGDVESAYTEGRYHAERCLDLGFTDTWIANMEAPYDAGGNSSAPQYDMPQAYAGGFLEAAAGYGCQFKALGVTTTPFFGSSTWPLAEFQWVTMPQAFTGAYAPATVQACVDHFRAWGWPPALIRPLVQVYEPRPAVEPYLEESKAAGVGVIPYIVEQAMDTAGRQMLGALTPATFRPPSEAPPTPPDGGDVQPIGSQNGVTAACNRLRDLDPKGTLMVKGTDGKWPPLTTLAETGLDKWKAWDKLERSLSILVANNDEMAGRDT